MAGGVGSRFWPISRAERPKQFLDILGTGKSLLRQTFERYAALCPERNIYVVTGAEHAALAAAELPELEERQILAEPARRNTAPCIAFAGEIIRRRDPEASIIVAPADHLILNEDLFRADINAALAFARDYDALVTIGLKPSRPDTGYGYIQYEGQPVSGQKIYKVKTFTEKPHLDLAKVFVASGDFLWNSGIFVWTLCSITRAFEAHLPDMAALFAEAGPAVGTADERAAFEKVYAACKSESVDYGIMEKAQNVFVVASEFGWSDLGTWGAMYEHSAKDADGNAGLGASTLAYDTSGCVVSAPRGKLVVLRGVRDLIVADAGESLLICRRDDEQQLRDIVPDIRRRFDGKYL